MKKIILFLLVAMAAVTAYCNEPKITKHIEEIADGYNYWLVEPANTDTPKPVVIFLHGASLRGNDLERVKRYGTLDAIIKGRQIDAYIIAPQVSQGAWSPLKIKQVLDDVTVQHNVDRDRVYVVGMSLGGYGTLDFAATYPELVAAAVGICGGASVRDASRLSEVPLWIVHGTGDAAVPVSQSDKVVETIKKADPQASRLFYDRVPGMNHSRPARMFYLPELYEWLFQHRLSDKNRPIHSNPVRVTEELLQGAYKGCDLRKK